MGLGFCTPAWVAYTVRFTALGIATAGSSAYAQLVPSVSAASAPATNSMERAQRQADNVMRWIKVHADKPRAAPAPTVKSNEPVAPVASVAKPVAAPKPAPPTLSPPTIAVEPAKPVEIPIPPVTNPPVATSPQVPAPQTITPSMPTAPEEQETDDDEPLKVKTQTLPDIPRNLRNSLTTARVLAEFTIETSGRTSKIQILNSSNRRLNEPTVSAISSWTFEPIKQARTQQVEFDFLQQ